MLISLSVLGALLVTVSCKKDEELLAAPTVSFQNGKTTHTAANVNDTVFETTITIDAPAELASIKVYKVSSTGKTTEKTITSGFTSDKQHIFQYKFRAGTYEVEATDKKDQTTGANFTFTAYVAPAGDITEYSARIMGAQFNNGVGSFFSTTNGTVYSKTDAKTSASLIDFVYSYRGAPYLAFMAAPSDALLDPTLDIKAEGWSKYNNTMFKSSTLTATEFDAIIDDAKLTAASGFTSTNVQDLKLGSVVYFKTEAGKLGVFKVKAINKGTCPTTGCNDIQLYQAGSIDIDVKVQK